MVTTTHYQFTVLPFCLAAAPWVFTKCMVVIAAFILRHQFQLFLYLDYWLMKGCSKTQMEVQVKFIRVTFVNLGLLLNKAKFTLSPIQRTEFIGAVLDSSQGRAYLPQARF